MRTIIAQPARPQVQAVRARATPCSSSTRLAPVVARRNVSARAEAKDGAEKIKEGGKDVYQAGKDAVKNTARDAKGALSDAADAISDAAKNTRDNVSKNVEKGVHAVQDKAGEVEKNLKDARK